MPLYTFYPFRADGTSLTFEAADLPSLAVARAHAERVLGEHISCAHVEVWQDEAKVAEVSRRQMAGAEDAD